MRSSLTLLTLFTTLATALPGADPSAVFYAELFHDSATCDRTSGTVHAYLYSMGPCQNFAVPGTGSARVNYNERPTNLTLTGWTEAGCKGEAVPFGTVVGQCVSVNGTAIASWSY